MSSPRFGHVTLTEQEIAMVETLRGWSEHREIRFTASFEHGAWECELIISPHPLYLAHHPECPPNAFRVDRGVGCGIRRKADRIPTQGGQQSDDCGHLLIAG